MIEYSFVLQVAINQVLILLKGITAALVIVLFQFLPKILFSPPRMLLFGFTFAAFLVTKSY